MRKDESTTEHYAKTNRAMHDKLVRRFFICDREGDADAMMKLSSQAGYMEQIHIGLNKNLLVERQIKDINKRLDRIPPELLEQYVANPDLLVKDAQQ